MKVSGSFDARLAEYNRLLATSPSFGGMAPGAAAAQRPVGKSSSTSLSKHGSGLKVAPSACSGSGRQPPPKPVLPRPVVTSARPTCLPHLQAVYDQPYRGYDVQEPVEPYLQEKSPRQSRSAEPPQRHFSGPPVASFAREHLAERHPSERREIYAPRDLAAAGGNAHLGSEAVPPTSSAPRSPRSPRSPAECEAPPGGGAGAARAHYAQEPPPAQSPSCGERRPVRLERRREERPAPAPARLERWKEALHRASTEELYRSPPRTPSTQRSDRHAERDLDTHRPRVRSIDASMRTASNRAPTVADRMAISRRGSAQTPAAQRQDSALEDDCAEYSDRFLAGYDKGRLLGRGACAVVWLAAPAGQKNLVAIKQVAKGNTGKKKSDTEAARKEIFFGSYLFHTGGEPKFPPAKYPGIQHVAKLLDYQETKRDIWLVMEYGGTSLTKMAYEIKGEFLRGERLYRVNHLPMLQSMKQDPKVLGGVLRQLLSALCILAEHHIVHSDIKPDNILVEEDAQHQLKVRFIDLGSAFTFDCPESLALATPEYMPPEALETCSSRGFGAGGPSRMSVGPRNGGSNRKPADPVTKLQQQSQPWSFDIWSLGSIVLELCTGTPLWLSYKCRVADDQRANSAAMGLFAVPGRDPEKIMQKQSDVMLQRGVHSVLRNAQGVPLNNSGPGTGQELLSMMLAWDPLERISPQEALEHPFLQV